MAGGMAGRSMLGRSMLGSSSAPQLPARGVHGGASLPPVDALPRAAAAAAAAAAAGGGSEDASAAGEWQIGAAAVAQFKRMFEQACAAVGPGTDRLEKSQAGAVLAMSGLPTEALLAIWALADLDRDERLDLREYPLCCSNPDPGPDR